MRLFSIALFSLTLLACSDQVSAGADDVPDATSIPEDAASLVVAGGCFWCVEKDFEAVDGVYEAVSGYSGGTFQDATYRNHPGHREVVEVFYDAQTVSYAELIHFFLRTIDVTDNGGQFCDRGFAYTTALHYRTDDERVAAEAAIAEAEATLGRDVVTPVLPFEFMVEAEGYHQDYYLKNPGRYATYRRRCGRDARVQSIWGDEAAAAH